MKNTNAIFIFILIGFLSSCSTKDATVAEENILIQSYTNDAESFIQQTGIRNLKSEKASWQDFHQNYKEITSTYKNHPNLHSYTSNLINHQILKTSFLDEVNSTNYSILKTYLNDLKNLKSPYTKVHFLILEALQPYVEKSVLVKFAKISHDKAIKSKQKEKENLEAMPETEEFEITLKQKLQKIFNEEYLVYLQKLENSYVIND